MPVEMEMPDSVDETGGAYLNAAGVFHCAVLEATETPTIDRGERKGELISNAAFGVDLEVLSGPQKGKQRDVVFFHPDTTKPKDSDGYQLTLRKSRRFCEAVGIVAERVPGGNKYQLDVTKARGRQLIVEFSFDTRPGKEKNLQLHFANIWHVDDPDSAAKCDRNQDALKLLPASLRRKPESFAKDKDKATGNGSASGGGSKPANQPAGAGAASQTTNLDDL